MLKFYRLAPGEGKTWRIIGRFIEDGRMGEEGVLERVLNGDDPDLRDDMGRTALMLAARKNDHEAMKKLIQSHRPVSGSVAGKGNLFSIDNNGRTALFHVAENDDEDAAWILLGSVAGTGLCCPRGTLLEMKDHEGLLAEEYARKKENEKVYKLLMGERCRIAFFE